VTPRAFRSSGFAGWTARPRGRNIRILHDTDAPLRALGALTSPTEG
jgi:hypothetical protein